MRRNFFNWFKRHGGGVICVLIFLGYSGAQGLPLIGTCYNFNYSQPALADEDFVDSTSIKSFRFGLSWGVMDSLTEPLGTYGWTFDSLAYEIANRFPPRELCVEPIFQFGFYHPTKMESGGGGLNPIPGPKAYRVDPDYEDDFADFCDSLATHLKSELDLDDYVLGNEYDLGWNPNTGEGVKWGSPVRTG